LSLSWIWVLLFRNWLFYLELFGAWDFNLFLRYLYLIKIINRSCWLVKLKIFLILLIQSHILRSSVYYLIINILLLISLWLNRFLLWWLIIFLFLNRILNPLYFLLITILVIYITFTFTNIIFNCPLLFNLIFNYIIVK
jgi:hypothetical protein